MRTGQIVAAMQGMIQFDGSLGLCQRDYLAVERTYQAGLLRKAFLLLLELLLQEFDHLLHGVKLREIGLAIGHARVVSPVHH